MGLSNKKSSDRRAARNVLDGYEPPSWEPPAPEDCDIDDPVAVDLDATTRIIQRFHRQWGRIVDYAIILQTHDGDEWIEVSKIDCCHAEVHIHHRRQSADDKRDVIREIRSQGCGTICGHLHRDDVQSL